MANAQFKAEYYAGRDIAQAVYLVDSTGTLYAALASSGGSVNVADPTTPSQKLAVDASGRIGVNNFPATQPVSGNVGVSSLPALVAGSALVGGVNVVDSGGTNKLAVDASGRLTLIPNSSVNMAQLSGVTPQMDGGSSNRLGVSLYGKNAAAGDTAFLLDSGGRLNVVQTIGGAAISATNAEPNISNIQQFILNGQAWSASTGIVSAVASEAGEWFVTNANTKNILIYSVRITYTNANQYAQFQYITTQDATITGAGTTSVSTALNLKGGGAAPASTWSMAYNAAATATGSALDFINLTLNQSVEFLPVGTFIYIPSATAGGIAAYCNTTAAGKWSMTVKWIEF